MGANSFNDMEIDAIGEIMNISLGASATAVSTMLGTTTNITTPKVRVLDGEEFEFKKLEPAIGVEIAYVEGLEGSNVMMFSRNDVRIIVGMLMGGEIPEEQFELDEINRSAVCEVMNQMMGSSATALSEFLGTPVNISTPISFEVPDEKSFKDKYFPDNETKVIVRFSLEVEGRLESEFLNIMSVALAKRLLAPYEAIFGGTQPEAAPEPAPAPAPAPEASGSSNVMSQAEIEAMMAGAAQSEPEPSGSSKVMSQAEIEAMMAGAAQSEPAPAPAPEPSGSSKVMSQAEIEAMMAGAAAQPEPEPIQAQPQVQAQPQAAPMQQPVYGAPVYQAQMDPMMLQLLNQMQQSQLQMMELMNSMKEREKERPRQTDNSLIHPVNSSQFSDVNGDGEEDAVNQEMLMKVPLEISVEIGRTKKLVKDILEFTQGSLVVLDKMAGEQAEMYVNGKCIAKGDIVVVEDNFGIRITEIVARNLNPESL